MIDKEKVEILLNTAIEGTDDFIVEFKISPSNNINILVDSPNGITIQRCVAISRVIEHNLDRDDEDFDLQVSSPGLSLPFKVIQQYHKNIGREIEITKIDDTKISATLLEIKDESILIEETRLEKIEGKKKKQTIIEQIRLPFSKIKSTKVIIAFK